jgi:hypothetical protein
MTVVAMVVWMVVTMEKTVAAGMVVLSVTTMAVSKE